MFKTETKYTPYPSYRRVALLSISFEIDISYRPGPNGTQMPPNPINLESYDDYGLDDMTRQRHVYETAFDCRISKSDDDLDQIDKVSNHPVLMEVSNTWEPKPLSVQSVDSNSLNRSNKNRELFQKTGQDDNSLVLALSQEIKVRGSLAFLLASTLVANVFRICI